LEAAVDGIIDFKLEEGGGGGEPDEDKEYAECRV